MDCALSAAKIYVNEAHWYCSYTLLVGGCTMPPLLALMRFSARKIGAKFDFYSGSTNSALGGSQQTVCCDRDHRSVLFSGRIILVQVLIISMLGSHAYSEL